MHFLYFANEVRDFGQIPKAEGEKVPKREIDLADSLIDKMSAEEFEPEKYHDEYRERILAMVDQKVKGKEVAVQPPTPERRGESGRSHGCAERKPGGISAISGRKNTHGNKDNAETTQGLKEALWRTR